MIYLSNFKSDMLPNICLGYILKVNQTILLSPRLASISPAALGLGVYATSL